MAGLQTIFNALPLLFDEEGHKQWNRTTVFLGELAARPGSVAEGAGKNVAFNAEFSGASAAAVPEGYDVPDSAFNSDIEEGVLFPWCTYQSNFKVTEREIDACRSSRAGASAMLRDLFGTRIMGALSIIADKIETDALTGTGVDGSGNPTLVGIYGGALAASGNYGGISVAQYSEWAANVVSNGGSSRALTKDLIDQADSNIFLASSKAWDLVMTSAGVTRKYEGLFTSATAPIIRMNDGAMRPAYGMGVANDAGMQLDALFYKGRKVLRNRVNPSGKLALLNTGNIKMKYLPRMLSEADKDFMRLVGIEGSSGGTAPIQATGMPLRLVVLGKTGSTIKVSAEITCAMAVTRRNSQALLTDISES